MANVSTVDDRNSIEALFQNFVRLGRDGMSSLLVPWLVIAGIDFGFVALSVISVWIAGTAGVGTAGGVAMQVFAVLQGIVVLTLRVALLKTLRDVALQGPSAVYNLGTVARDVGSRIVPSLLITLAVGAIVALGMLLCVLPGLVALFFLAFAPYLVAAQGMSVVNGLRRSATWAAREWPVLLSAIIVAVLAGGLMGCVMGLLGSVTARDVIAVPAGLFGGWIVNTLFGYLAFLWWGAVYVTAESRQQVETFHKTAPVDEVTPGPGQARQRDRSSESDSPQDASGSRTSIYRSDETPGDDGDDFGPPSGDKW